MPEKNTTAIREQTRSNASCLAHYVLVVVMSLLPASAFAGELESRNIPVGFEPKIFRPATFFDQPRFTLSPVTGPASSTLSLDRRLLLTQAGSVPAPAGGNSM